MKMYYIVLFVFLFVACEKNEQLPSGKVTYTVDNKRVNTESKGYLYKDGSISFYMYHHKHPLTLKLEKAEVGRYQFHPSSANILVNNTSLSSNHLQSGGYAEITKTDGKTVSGLFFAEFTSMYHIDGTLKSKVIGSFEDVPLVETKNVYRDGHIRGVIDGKDIRYNFLRVFFIDSYIKIDAVHTMGYHINMRVDKSITQGTHTLDSDNISFYMPRYGTKTEGKSVKVDGTIDIKELTYGKPNVFRASLSAKVTLDTGDIVNIENLDILIDHR